MTKPEKDRKPCPRDPYSDRGGSLNKSLGGKGGIRNRAELDEINAAAVNAWSTAVLEECRHCGRRFLPEKLAIHNKACNSSHPSRRVSETVNRREALGLSTTGSQITSHQNRYNTEFLTKQLDQVISDASISINPTKRSRTFPRSPAARPQHRVPQGLAIGEAGFSVVLDASVSSASIYRAGSQSSQRIALPTNMDDDDEVKSPPPTNYSHALQQKRSMSLRASGGMLDAAPHPGNESILRGVGGRRSVTVLQDNNVAEVPKWKKDSLQFRNALKLAKRATLVESGRAVSGDAGVESPELVEDDRILCPHCNRRYSEKAAERHIPLCRDIHNKPTRLRSSGVGLSATAEAKREGTPKANNGTSSNIAKTSPRSQTLPSQASSVAPSKLPLRQTSWDRPPAKRSGPVPINRRPSWKGVGSEFLSPQEETPKKLKAAIIDIDVGPMRRTSMGIGSGTGAGGRGGAGTAPRAVSSRSRK